MNTTCRLARVFQLLAVLVMYVSPQPAAADAAPRWTDAQLVGFSDLIVRGRVTRVAAGRDERVPSLYTYVTVEVADVVKGSLPDRHIVLKQLGGRLGSTALEIAGQPAFQIGEQ